MIGFEHIRSEAGPVAADLIELTGFRGAVTCVIRQHGDEFSLGVMSCQHGDSLVGRAVGNFAEVGPLAVGDQSSVHRKTGFAEARRQVPRSPRCDGLIDDFDELLDQLRFVLSEVRGMIIRNRVKDIRRETPQPWCGVGMCAGNRKSFAWDLVLGGDAFEDGFGDFDWDSAVVYSE